MTNTIVTKSSGVVYRNPKPYLRSIVAYHPSLTLLSDKEYVATFDLGEAVESFDYHTVVARSTDYGKTWTVTGRLLSDAPQRTTHTIRTSRLRDGTLVGFGGLHDRENQKEGLVNRHTFGFVPVDLFVVNSLDKGKSWSKPTTIQPPLIGPSWEVCHHIVELDDGRWLAPTATWRAWNGDHPSGEQAVVLISDDKGKSWPSFGRTFDGRESGISHLEQSVIQLQDGRVLAVSWAHDTKSGNNFPSVYSLSEDRGGTFSPPIETGFLAQTAKVVQLDDGRLLCVYRRNDKPGLWATLAGLEGNKWINLGKAPLWQGAESGMSGKSNSGEELSLLKFGYPSVRQVATDELLLLFWCQEDCINNIRWLRLRVT
jgi:hypothetical protein